MPKMRPAPDQPDETSRYTLRMSNGHQHKLAQIAKEYKISQSEVLEAMIDHIDLNTLGPVFQGIRDAKVAQRDQKKELIKRLSKLDAGQLAALEKMAAGGE